MVPAFLPQVLALLEHPDAEVRRAGMEALPGLRDVSAEVLQANAVGTRLLTHPDARVRGVGVWARLVEEGAGGLVSHVALHLTALLRDDRVRTAAQAQASGGDAKPLDVTGPAADGLDVVPILKMQIDAEPRLRASGSPDVPSLGAPVLQRCLWWLTLDRLPEPVPTPTEAWLSLLQDADPAVRALATAASAQLRLIPPRLRARWSALRTDPDMDVRVLARAALLLHGAAEAEDRADVEGLVKRRADWLWAPMVREFLRQAPR
jgi:hypothetical protein